MSTIACEGPLTLLLFGNIFLQLTHTSISGPTYRLPSKTLNIINEMELFKNFLSSHSNESRWILAQEHISHLRILNRIFRSNIANRFKLQIHTSGAAYGGEPHQVANNSSGWKKFEKPKSAILILIFESNSRFSA